MIFRLFKYVATNNSKNVKKNHFLTEKVPDLSFALPFLYNLLIT